MILNRRIALWAAAGLLAIAVPAAWLAAVAWRTAGPPTEADVLVGRWAAPYGNLLFVTQDVLLVPAMTDLCRVTLGPEVAVQTVYTHPEWIYAVGLSPDGQRTVVGSPTGLTELLRPAR